MSNQVTISGRIKNIKSVGKTGTIVTANLSQYGYNPETNREFCITTMPLVFIDNGDKALGLTDGTEVEIIGSIKTRFDKRPNIENANRFKPFTQIEVSTLVTA
jgi:hypothetical protein